MSSTGNEGMLGRQWRGYPPCHASRANLLLHLVAVPVFLMANITLIAGLMHGAWITAGVAVVVMAMAMAAQARGHNLEPVPPEPFTGPSDAILRIFAEQWITFPRFVVSARWAQAIRQAR